jgi:Rrf2 family protein
VLPKTAEYALRAVVWLAQTPDTRVSADAIARHTKVPRRYLHKVLQDLGCLGLVNSQPGPRGGYALGRPPEEITILDVVSATAPMERIRRCPLGLRSHTRLCPLHRELDDVYAVAQQSLARVKIAALVRSTSAITPLCEVKG